MISRIFSVLFLCVLVVGCETPPTDGANTGDNGGAGGIGSENQGAGGGELAPGVSDTVYFAYDSSALTSEATAVLGRQAQYLKENSSMSVVVEGHCDERGTREYNLALGERRANATKQFLVNAGVPASRLSTISYGKERPVAVGSDEASWALNRRTVTVSK